MLQRKVGIFPAALLLLACGIGLYIAFTTVYATKSHLGPRANLWRGIQIDRVDCSYAERSVTLSKPVPGRARTILYALKKPPVLSSDEQEQIKKVIRDRLMEGGALAPTADMAPGRKWDADPGNAQLYVTITPTFLEDGLIDCQVQTLLYRKIEVAGRQGGSADVPLESANYSFYTTGDTLLEELLTRIDGHMTHIADWASGRMQSSMYRQYKRRPDGSIDVQIQKTHYFAGGGSMPKPIFDAHQTAGASQDGEE